MLVHSRVDLALFRPAAIRCCWHFWLIASFCVAGVAEVHADTLEELADEARALSNASDVATFAKSGAELIKRATDSLKGNELESVQSIIGDAAAAWLQKAGVADGLSGKELDFLVFAGLDRLDESRRAEVAAEWILKPNAMKRLTSFAIHRLGEAAESTLTPAQRAELLAKSDASMGAVTYKQLLEHLYYKTKFLQSKNAEVVLANHRRRVADWCAANDCKGMPQEQVDWLVNKMMPEYLGSIGLREIDAVWDTTITPSRSGDYVFSVGPLNLGRSDEEASHLHQWLTIEVGGRRVLTATPQTWQSESSSVSLQKGQPARVKVSLKYRLKDLMSLPMHVQLSWRGPGIASQPIAAKYFKIEGEGKPGVRLAVTRREAGDEQTCTVIVNAIDQVLGKHAICAYESTVAAYAEELIGGLISDAAMSLAVAQASDLDPAKRQTHPIIGDSKYRSVLMKATSGIRRTVASKLALQPELLRPLDLWTLVYFYDVVRFGAEREALDLVGAWMVAHSNQPSALAGSTSEFYDINRKAFRHLTIPFVLENPENAQWIEQDYLKSKDGECCLPAAYVVAYSHLASGRMLEWIEKLDTELNDKQNTGDSRVNWLIARAMAEEIRSSPEGMTTYPGMEQITAGMGYLDEAMLVAKSRDAQDRVACEIASRLAAHGKIDAASEAVRNRDALVALQRGLQELKSAAKGRDEQERTAANAAFAASLKRRIARANGRSDSAAAAKYEAALEAYRKK